MRSALHALTALFGAIVFTSGAGLVMARAPRVEEPRRDSALTSVYEEPDRPLGMDRYAVSQRELTTFCGGGGGWMDRPEPERYRDAREMAIDALREGRVEEWERPSALAMLAEAQLLAGEHGRAIANYRRAPALDADSVPEARVGLATALFASGDERKALAEARLARASVCASRTSTIACYSAISIVARTSRSSADRGAAELALRMIRDAHPEAAWPLDVVDQRLR